MREPSHFAARNVCQNTRDLDSPLHRGDARIKPLGASSFHDARAHETRSVVMRLKIKIGETKKFSTCTNSNSQSAGHLNARNAASSQAEILCLQLSSMKTAKTNRLHSCIPSERANATRSTNDRRATRKRKKKIKLWTFADVQHFLLAGLLVRSFACSLLSQLSSALRK